MKIKQQGFTIIELLIATTVFTVVLLLMTTGLIQIGRTYYKGLTSIRAQEATRSIIDDVAQTLRFNGGNFSVAEEGELKSFCAGFRRYTFTTNKGLMNDGDPNNRILGVDNNLSGTACEVPDDFNAITAERQQLIGENMRLGEFTINTINDNLYEITVEIGYGEDVLFVVQDGGSLKDEPQLMCKNNRSGGQFCSVSKLTTTVEKRL